MTLPQQKFREIVFQLLYSCDIGSPEDKDIIKLLMCELNVSRKNVAEALDRARQILAQKDKLDEQMGKSASEYALERIQTIEKNILRLSIYEMEYDDLIPPKVAIAEAIRLCRKFSNPESASFVNALLDTIYRRKKEIGHLHADDPQDGDDDDLKQDET